MYYYFSKLRSSASLNAFYCSWLKRHFEKRLRETFRETHFIVKVSIFTKVFIFHNNLSVCYLLPNLAAFFDHVRANKRTQSAWSFSIIKSSISFKHFSWGRFLNAHHRTSRWRCCWLTEYEYTSMYTNIYSSQIENI